VFLIVVVLMNLLNGLAVSDTGLIQAKAEIVSYTTQVHAVHRNLKYKTILQNA
jgi:hypothetical protein